MNIKQLSTLKNAYDRKKELDGFLNKLKENPLQESEYRSLIDNSNLDPRERIQYYEGIKTLRKQEMIIDDIPEPYSDFVTRVEKEGFVPIKKSVMKQMSADEFQQFSAKRFLQYDDLNGRENVQHYRFRTKSGLIQETGKGISVKHIDSQDVEKISQAQKSYSAAKNEIGKVLEEISVNSDKYQDFRPAEKSENQT